jgi:hypothetical protein
MNQTAVSFRTIKPTINRSSALITYFPPDFFAVFDIFPAKPLAAAAAFDVFEAYFGTFRRTLAWRRRRLAALALIPCQPPKKPEAVCRKTDCLPHSPSVDRTQAVS